MRATYTEKSSMHRTFSSGADEANLRNPLPPSRGSFSGQGPPQRERRSKPKLQVAKKAETPKTRYEPIVPAVEQAGRVLLCLAESSNSRMRLTDICGKVGIHKSKGHSILNTLRQFGFVEKDPYAKTYSLGPGLMFLARNFLDNLSYPEVAAPFLEPLARETSGTALFGLINGKQLFVVAKHEGNQNIGFTLRLGHRFHITLGAHGKAIVAFLPESEKETLLATKNLYFYGEKDPLDMTRLRQELAACREQGFAQDLGRITPGVNVVSAPVFGPDQKMVGCIVLIGTFKESMIETYGPKVVEAARQISCKLGAPGDRPFGNRMPA